MLLLELWRCDRQHDCKDGSDERACVYPATNASLAGHGFGAPTTTATMQPGESPVHLEQETGDTLAPSARPSFINHDTKQSEDYYSTSDLSSTKQPTEVSLARQRALESSVIDDTAQTVDQSREQPARSGQEAGEQVTASTTPSAPDSPASSTPAELVPPTEANQPKASASTLDAGELGAATSSAKELKKFDYDIIASMASVPAQTNSENLLKSMHTHQSQVANQMMTQIDFVPQQPQQQQQSHQVKVQQQHNGQQPPIRLANERVPIYRSLFKTLKGGPGKLQVSNGLISQQQHAQQIGPNRYAVVSSRHRRERAPTLPESTDSAAAASSMATKRQAGQVQSHGVASYLQLLNSRYNLRLARVAPQPASSGAPIKLHQ